jgi:hypothetical protein
LPLIRLIWLLVQFNATIVRSLRVCCTVVARLPGCARFILCPRWFVYSRSFQLSFGFLYVCLPTLRTSAVYLRFTRCSRFVFAFQLRFQFVAFGLRLQFTFVVHICVCLLSFWFCVVVSFVCVVRLVSLTLVVSLFAVRLLIPDLLFVAPVGLFHSLFCCSSSVDCCLLFCCFVR